ncbi:hypothetical protein M8J77_016910 [Diaphorina citri]|nr:hypothetical protein M8J77_016910 [Diaphorina citri]
MTNLLARTKYDHMLTNFHPIHTPIYSFLSNDMFHSELNARSCSPHNELPFSSLLSPLANPFIPSCDQLFHEFPQSSVLSPLAPSFTPRVSSNQLHITAPPSSVLSPLATSFTPRLTVPDSLLYAQSSRRESNYLPSPNNTINNNINYSNLVTCTPHCDDTLLFSPTFYNTTYCDYTNIHNTNVGCVLPDYEPRCRWPDNLIQINLQNPAHSTSRPTERGVPPLPIPPSTSLPASTSPPPSTLPSSSSLPPSVSPQSTSPPSAAHLLSVYYQNVRGLRTKLKDLRTNVHLENRDIFAFTETNLTESHFNSELGFDSFAVFRYDRCSASSKKKSGGGVLLAVSHSIPCSQISLCVNNIEQIFIRLFLGSQTFVIGLVYIPPASSAEIYSAYWDEVTRVRSLHPQDHFLLLGDYNLPDASWDAGAGVVPSGSTAQSTITIEQSFFQDFNQHNLVKNDNGKSLDLVFSSLRRDECSVASSEPLLPVDSHHPPLSVTCIVPVPIEVIDDDFHGFQFRKGNYLLINKIFSSFDWKFFLSSENVEDNVQSFHTFVHDVIKCFVPSFHIRKDSYPIWYTSYLKTLIIRKKLAHRLYKSTFSPHHYNEFSRLRSLCKSVSVQCYSSYVPSVEKNIRTNPRYFWKYERSLRTDSSLPKNLEYNGERSSSPESSANLFRRHFESAFTSSPGFQLSCDLGLSDSLSSVSISRAEILGKLKSLNVHKGSGPDGIPNRFLKECRFSLAFPLFLLFNQSLSQGVFPRHWKKCFISPIPKRGVSKTVVTNYRPIAILSAVPKIFESLVLDKLLPFIHHSIIPHQHGFIPGKSVSTNLLEYSNFISSNLSSGTQVDSIYLDLTKAFDRVNHKVLLSKLRGHGIEGTLLEWFASYLSGRICFVRVGSSFSSPFSSVSGVPQGSHLAPILFLLFINDVPKCLSDLDVSLLLFADDIKLFKAIKSFSDHLVLQNALVALNQWLSTNLLDVNPSKCNVITFSRSRSPSIHSYFINLTEIPRSECLRDLGVLFDNKMSFLPHVNLICSRASRMLGFINRTTKDFRDVLPIKVLYCSLVRGILEFSSSVWNPSYAYHSSNIERIQNRALRIMSYRLNTPNASYSSLQSTLELLPLSTRRTLYDVIMFFNIIHSKVDTPGLLAAINLNVPTRTSRTPFPFSPPFVRANYLQNSPMIRFQRTANQLSNDIDIFSTSVQEIKNFFNRFDQNG